jgi:hypothetical protein
VFAGVIFLGGMPCYSFNKHILVFLKELGFDPVTAADKVALFKVITAKDEIVSGLTAEELAQMDGNAGGVAKALVAKGSLSVWRYAVRKAASGDLEQAPLHKVGLISTESLRVEPYATPLKVVPIEETRR